MILLTVIFSTLLVTFTIADEANANIDSFSTLSLSASSAQVCSCDDINETNILEENAKRMQEQTKNKTMINKIRHRVSHSSEAMWASFCLSSLLGVMMLALLQSKMWRDNTFLSYPESQPSRYEQDNHKAEIKVKQLIKSKGRKLLKHFSRKKKSNVELQGFQMETFLKQTGDEVDGSYLELIDSSSEDDSSDDSDEDVVFSLNRSTGYWQSGKSVKTHKGDSRGNYNLLKSSNRRDLSRHSESSSEANHEVERLINV